MVSSWRVQQAAREIRAGAVIAYPTEAVWGLGCDPWNEEAVDRLLAIKSRSVDKGQVVSCRLPAEELHAFDALCTQLGAKSRSDGVRSVVRMASGFLEFSREDSAKLEEIRYELGKIGTNVNQIALAANRGRAPMVKAQWASVDELRRSLPMVAKALSQIIAERRRQGVALFRKFAESQEGARHG